LLNAAALSCEQAMVFIDRVAFPDDRCFVIGSSIKDAAVKRPTYIVEHSGGAMREIYEKEWAGATPVVKG
jgi:hypothetical protein